MTATMKLNGTPRKSLSQQLDRLDSILDGLSEGLCAAVADAVSTAVRQAVETALSGLVTHPEILAKLHAPAPPSLPAHATPAHPTQPKPATRPSLVRRGWNSVWGTVCGLVGRVRATVTGGSPHQRQAIMRFRPVTCDLGAAEFLPKPPTGSGLRSHVW